MAKEKFLALAFTDLDGNNHFNAKKDALIAGVIDTDKSHSVSVGDMVTFGTFPHLDGTQAGTFLGADTAVTSVIQADSAVVAVGVADGFAQWGASNSIEAFFTTVPVSGATEASFTDEIIDNPQLKSEGAHTSAENGPADPDVQFLAESVIRLGDDGFLDVFIA